MSLIAEITYISTNAIIVISAVFDYVISLHEKCGHYRGYFSI